MLVASSTPLGYSAHIAPSLSLAESLHGRPVQGHVTGDDEDPASSDATVTAKKGKRKAIEEIDVTKKTRVKGNQESAE